jgi:hypothetical protein
MSISLNQLKSAMNKITQAGYLERKVSLGENTLIIRTLTPKEESELQKIISDLSRDETMTTLEFVDVVRKETLSRAIVQIDDLDMRNIDMVETDEVLPNGVKVKVSRQQAISEMIEFLPRLLLSKVFEEMSRLTEEVEERTNKLLKIDVVDIDAEIEILEKRIKQLEFQKETRKLDQATVKNTSNALAIKGDETLAEQLKKVDPSV